MNLGPPPLFFSSDRNTYSDLFATLATATLAVSLLSAAAKFAMPSAVKGALDRSFYVYDLGRLDAAYAAWKRLLPEVRPFYAVKCNPDPRVVGRLRELGAGFDCASRAEIDLVRGLGAHAGKDVVYAHPCKHPADLRHAVAQGVRLATFDNVREVDKLISLGGLGWGGLLRIAVPPRPDGASSAVHDLGLKYGASTLSGEAQELLAYARGAGLNVVGVSFHAGSMCTDPSAFGRAVEAAATLVPDMTVLDIGGGFGKKMPLPDAAPAIRKAVATHTKKEVRVIAEPGRYFAEGCATVFAQVHGKRERPHTCASGQKVDYFIADGLYGSFNCVVYDSQAPSPPVALRFSRDGEYRVLSSGTERATIWGPTCDSGDLVAADVEVPAELEIGDWLAFPDAGAYTIAGACDFNGIPMSSPPALYGAF